MKKNLPPPSEIDERQAFEADLEATFKQYEVLYPSPTMSLEAMKLALDIFFASFTKYDPRVPKFTEQQMHTYCYCYRDLHKLLDAQTHFPEPSKTDNP